MVERKASHGGNPIKTSSSLSLSDFVEYVEKQTRAMELSGWKDVQGLRRWISELRKQSYQMKTLSD